MSADPSDDDPPPAPPPAARGARADRRPLYRVVEFMRDEQGRVLEQGRVWHSDLRRVRQFGRAVADNTAGSRVVIADNAGRVVEELPLPGLAHAEQGRWEGWRDRALPPLPRPAERPRLKREAATTPAAAWVVPTPASAPCAGSPAAAAADASPPAALPAAPPAAQLAAPPVTPADAAPAARTEPPRRAPRDLPTLSDPTPPVEDPSGDVEVLLP